MLVAGDWSAASGDNFRQISFSEDQAFAYIRSTGFNLSDTFLYAIVRVSYAVLSPTPNRKGWEELEPETRKRYLGSRAAKYEAQFHQMSVPEWYRFAPDLKAFRGHARGRAGPEGITGQQTEWIIYIARDYKVTLTTEEAARISAGVKQAATARRGEFDRYLREAGFGEFS